MILRFGRIASRAALGFLPLLAGACMSSGDRAVVVGGNQGSYSVQHEANPMDSMPRQNATAATAPVGPTARELQQQQRIDQLEAQQRGLQAEIDRLKKEKGK